MGKRFELTDEGRKYLKSGLPEKNLLEVLRKGPIAFDRAKNSVENFSVAFQWAKKKGWVEVKDGKLRIVKEPPTMPEQEILRRVGEGEDVSADIVEVLVKRNLVKAVVKGEVDELVGKEVTNLTPQLLKTGLWKQVKFRPFNVEFVGKKMYGGKRQPYNQFLLEVRQKLAELGFREIHGRTITTEFWNFDALYQAQDHPSRDWTQTYSLKYPQYGDLPNKEIVDRVKATHENGWKTGSTGWGYKWDERKASRLMPVAHDTAISPITLASKGLEIPGKYFQIVRCYRPDVIDAKHGVEFNQMGGFVVSKDLNFKHLLGLLKQFVHELIGPYEVKFTTAYFPFTEPSCEISVKHPEMGWVESAGAGIFRPELTEPLGVDEPVIAWGFGIDRLAMFKLGVNDIRNLFSSDLDWLRKKEVV
jgi:phenylalanyl-tRNA synthetase alpha chain